MCTFYLLATLLYFICHGNSQEDHCFPSEFLASLSMSMKITKAGFHRDLHYSVQWGKVDHDVKALLVQKLPSGVYMDEYQLETLKHDTGLEVLLDSKVDLEAPEYLSSGFTALVFLSGTHEVIIPVHGRYHRPSNSSQKWVKVDIEPPRLLLRSDQSAAFIKGRYCVHLDCRGETPSGTLHLLHRNVLSEAPCTVRNQRLCSWLEVLHLEDAGGVSLEIPVGDSSMTLGVCFGTVLTAALSCAYLLRTVWRHGTF